MTTETEPNTGISGERDQSGGNLPSRASKSPEIHIKMPDPDSGSPSKNGTRAGGAPVESTERLLLKLMARLDENDRHYGQALDNLNNRLTALSQHADTAGTSTPARSTAALDRLRDQASSLAAQVSDAGAAHRAQHSRPDYETGLQPGAAANPLEEASPCGAKPAVNDDLASVTKRLERSLEAGAPAASFETLSNRMAELACHLDAALESRDAPDRLHSIEARLEELARGFANAQQHYARIEDIEGHLLRLMNWAQSADAPVNNSTMCSRLDAIERALQALNEKKAVQLEAPAAPAGPSSSEYPIESGEIDPPLAANGQDGAREDAGPSIEERPEANRESGPPAPIESRRPERRKEKADRRAQTPGRIEPAFETDNDFIASARRAAEAAERQAPENGAPESDTGGSRANTTRPIEKLNAVKRTSSGGKRPRVLFVAAAAGLLLVSSGILIGQLNTKPETPAANSIRKEAVQPAAPAPKAPAAEVKKQSSLRAPGAEKQKLHSGRMVPTQRKPARAKSAAPAAAPRPAPVTPANYRASAPAREPLAALPLQRVSTATLLASLSQETAPGLLPDVQVTVKEPSGPAPARRPLTSAPAASPALVPPPGSASRANPLAQPKRAPSARIKNNLSQSDNHPVDSAPARKPPQPMPSRTTAMPPLRIGPLSLRVAAARGNPAAQVEVASRFARGTGVAKNLIKAAEWFKRAAAQGFAPAQYHLAALHERGLGVKKDIALARSWYRRAAELGNIRAMHNLAVLHTRANPENPDYTAAKNWFHEAARHGLADSQFNLGILYESGLGAAKNAAEAYKWFTLAARQGDGEARKRREAIRPNLPTRSLAAVEKTLRRWSPATPREAANKIGQPRGGWQYAELSGPAAPTRSAVVSRAQKLLNKLGYNAGRSDGKLGPQTITAIRKFENRSGIPQTGRVTPKLMQRLDALSG